MPQSRQAALAAQTKRKQDAEKCRQAALEKRKREETKRRQDAREKRRQEEEKRKLDALKARKQAADDEAWLVKCDDCGRDDISDSRGGFRRHLFWCAAYQARVQRDRRAKEVAAVQTRASIDRVNDGNMCLY